VRDESLGGDSSVVAWLRLLTPIVRATPSQKTLQLRWQALKWIGIGFSKPVILAGLIASRENGITSVAPDIESRIEFA